MTRPVDTEAAAADDDDADCSVKVAVHIRPLLGHEILQGSKHCVIVHPSQSQVQIGTHSFTYNYVYGSNGSPLSAMFKECVSPLVDGLFQGYNATVLAYGQTGSGKTYTMGTGLKDGLQNGLISQVMTAFFEKIQTLKGQCEFQLVVSYIEIHKEEILDLLDPARKPECANGTVGRVIVPGKPPIQIRETSNGVISLSGCTEVSVDSINDMAACLKRGSLYRTTGSTNMNDQSSRSHAIFTILVEQRRKHCVLQSDNNNALFTEDYLSAKLHLVDLAGSERVKKTGSYGLRFKEGVHINKGLLALGNVISALGDKKRKGVYIPYRQSKLTRLLQDSLGGNSRTLMIACISPADINAEETLNTLKYASRARNIQNKPVVNRDPVSNEVLKLRQKLEVLQAELSARSGQAYQTHVQGLNGRIALLEAKNEALSNELHMYRSRCAAVQDYKTVSIQLERDLLPIENGSVSSNADPLTQKSEFLEVESQTLTHKNKHEGQIQLLKPKEKSDEAVSRLQKELQIIKGQKVRLQHKMKQEAEQYRHWKVSRDKELMKLRKEGMRNEFEKRKLQAFNQRQKLVLQRKTEEVALATKRLKELLDVKKSAARDNTVVVNENGSNLQDNGKQMQRLLDHELDVMVNVHAVRFDYEKQSKLRTALAEELSNMKQVNDDSQEFVSTSGNNESSRVSSMSPNTRASRISSLESMLNNSSNSLLAMTSQLSEAEEREHMFLNRGRWNQLRSMGEARHLLQHMFINLYDVRCRLLERDIEIKEVKEQMRELELSRQNETQRQEVEKDVKFRELAVATTSTAAALQGDSPSHPKPLAAQKKLKTDPANINPGKSKSLKRNHHHLLQQLKWKWEKPWKLSEWMKHNDQTIMSARLPSPQAFTGKI